MFPDNSNALNNFDISNDPYQDYCDKLCIWCDKELDLDNEELEYLWTDGYCSRECRMKEQAYHATFMCKWMLNGWENWPQVRLYLKEAYKETSND